MSTLGASPHSGTVVLGPQSHNKALHELQSRLEASMYWAQELEEAVKEGQHDVAKLRRALHRRETQLAGARECLHILMKFTMLCALSDAEGGRFHRCHGACCTWGCCRCSQQTLVLKV